jgi:hypothetical protein
MGLMPNVSLSPLVWTREEAFCRTLVDYSLPYNILLLATLSASTFYIAHSMRVNLAKLSDGQKLLTGSTLVLLNFALSYIPVRYLQKQVSPKLAEQQLTLVTRIKEAQANFEKNQLFTGDQAKAIKTPSPTISQDELKQDELQAEISRIAASDPGLQQNPCAQAEAWKAQWANIRRLRTLDLHAPLPNWNIVDAFFLATRVDDGEFTDKAIRLINIAKLIQENTEADKEKGLMTRYNAMRFEYANELTHFNTEFGPRTILEDPCFKALSDPPREQLSEERKNETKMSIVGIALIMFQVMGGIIR